MFRRCVGLYRGKCPEIATNSALQSSCFRALEDLWQLWVPHSKACPRILKICLVPMVPRFDCESGYMNWVHGWSPANHHHQDHNKDRSVEVGDASQGSSCQVRSHRSLRLSTRYLVMSARFQIQLLTNYTRHTVHAYLIIFVYNICI